MTWYVRADSFPMMTIDDAFTKNARKHDAKNKHGNVKSARKGAIVNRGRSVSTAATAIIHIW
jgi:hypothetical protein